MAGRREFRSTRYRTPSYIFGLTDNTVVESATTNGKSNCPQISALLQLQRRWLAEQKIASRTGRICTKGMPADGASRDDGDSITSFALAWGAKRVVRMQVGTAMDEAKRRLMVTCSDRPRVDGRVVLICAGMGAAADLGASSRLRVVALVENDPHARAACIARTEAPCRGSLEDVLAAVEAGRHLPTAEGWIVTLPCQAYSSAGQKLGERDARGGPILDKFLSLLTQAKPRPKWIIYESVLEFRHYAAYARLKRTLQDLGFTGADLDFIPYGVGGVSNRGQMYLVAISTTDMHSVPYLQKLIHIRKTLGSALGRQEWKDITLTVGVPPRNQWLESGVVQQTDWRGLRKLYTLPGAPAEPVARVRNSTADGLERAQEVIHAPGRPQGRVQGIRHIRDEWCGTYYHHGKTRALPGLV